MFYGFDIANLIWFFCLIALGGISFLIWWKAKAPAALLMMVGFAAMFLGHIFVWWGIWVEVFTGCWLPVLGLATATFGFALTFWTKIQGDIEHLRDIARDKIAAAAHKGSGETKSAPPPPPPPPPAKEEEAGEAEE